MFASAKIKDLIFNLGIFKLPITFLFASVFMRETFWVYFPRWLGSLRFNINKLTYYRAINIVVFVAIHFIRRYATSFKNKDVPTFKDILRTIAVRVWDGQRYSCRVAYWREKILPGEHLPFENAYEYLRNSRVDVRQNNITRAYIDTLKNVRRRPY